MTERWLPAYVGLGSNLSEPREQIRRACQLLLQIPRSTTFSFSSAYQSTPLGGKQQPDYINAVAGFMTRLSPLSLLEALQAIELRQGRERGEERWAPRTLDLDLLAVSSQTIDSAPLTLPHPGIRERSFVLLPWREIAPDFTIPGVGRVRDAAVRFDGLLQPLGAAA